MQIFFSEIYYNKVERKEEEKEEEEEGIEEIEENFFKM